MDEIMEDVVGDHVENDDIIDIDIDFEYEFDACQFYDFTRGETLSESRQAEDWFRSANEYPPSPFIAKLKMMKAAKANKKAHKKTEADKKSSTSSVSDGDADHKAASREVKIKGVKHQNRISQDNVKAKSKSTVNLSKPSGSFMKPTASHLAKQNKECDMHSGGCGRLQKPLASLDDKLRSPIICQSQATKRQKLDIGYLRKVAQLKHRASYLHKVTKKAAHLEGILNSKVKTTIPQKPALVTEERAIRRRSQNKSESVQQPKANTNAYGAQPLNKKILDAPKFLAHKKSMTHLTGLQDFRMQTSDRAMQVQSANVLHKQNSAPLMSQDIRKSKNSGNAGKKDICRSPNNLKTCTTYKVHPITDSGYVLNAKSDSHLPPIELFKKLSLKSESEKKDISSSRQPRLIKGLKENVPQSFQPDFRV
ncbi:TPX2 [Artemisia annua]|uniref:TPX2 n=1 Tax=Artemisia annua TaxID=35608 RepID=A0A2U1LGQ9_ARTAN|nr:TPX2 [Artemisia annua]